MNFFQLLSQLLGSDYSQEDIAAMVLLKYKQLTQASISRNTVMNRLQQPIGNYKEFTENFNDTLCAVAGTDVRAAIVKHVKETELV